MKEIFEFDAPETPEEARARLAVEVAEAKAIETQRNQHAEMLRRARSPLVGDSSAVGQGQMFAPDADLFSGPTMT